MTHPAHTGRVAIWCYSIKGKPEHQDIFMELTRDGTLMEYKKVEDGFPPNAMPDYELTQEVIATDCTLDQAREVARQRGYNFSQGAS